jgi:hypothetical protein
VLVEKAPCYGFDPHQPTPPYLSLLHQNFLMLCRLEGPNRMWAIPSFLELDSPTPVPPLPLYKNPSIFPFLSFPFLLLFSNPFKLYLQNNQALLS